MAPTCSDPRQIVITLNPARRQALLKLVDEITSYMISQLEAPDDELGPILSTPQNESGPSTPSDEHRSSTPKGDDPNKRAQQPNKTSVQALRIQKAAIKHMNEWKQEFMPKLEEIVRVKDDHKIQDERRKHQEASEKKKLDTPEEGENLISFGEVKVDKSEDIASLQALYHPIPTRLTTIPAADRREAISCILLLLLSTGKYSAHTRALALHLASSLEIPQTFIIMEEIEIAKTLLESSKDQDKQQEVMSAEAEASKRREDNKFSRFWKVGVASVAGAAVIGITGGLAAPLVAGAVGGILGGVGLGGVASFLGIFWMNGALVGALFGAYGGKMTGEMMDKYAKEVEDFRFIPLKGEWGEVFNAEKDEAQAQERRLRVTIGINGWLRDEDDVTKPWRILNDDSEVFALRYEMKSLIALGHALRNMVESFAWKKLKVEIIKRTVFATLLAALWPIQLLAAASNIDNPFGHAHNRSRKAGQLLADALINKVQGERPVTLVGYSLGATAIHACLQSLAERHAFGLIDTVVIIGAPAPSAPPHWRTLRTVVSGKIFNVYSENDLILGFVYRAHSLAMGVSGLQNIQEVEGIQNLDLSDTVSGHLRYPDLIGEILNKCGFVGIKASSEIEKDELIMMKDRHAEGELIDFEGTQLEGKKSPRSPGQEEIEKDLHGLNISPPALASPSQAPGQENQQQAPVSENPPLPQRPTAQDDSEAVPQLPRRPVASEAQSSSGGDKVAVSPPLPRRPTEPQQEEKSAIPRRPVGAEKKVNPPLPRRPIESSHDTHQQQQRPWTPESNLTDDEEYGHIAMVNYDSDHSMK
ncbi:hypothetical protein NW762_000241 [Fusarium torreyae]|uniref:Uncharacterized protein n=1 Tax=Fusarium torreyae TaxID=1237075 RepID=A0A9W8VN78_9HYPO|nr:hypothetical protein NW762_000241 [Fusarium torreyae]